MSVAPPPTSTGTACLERVYADAVTERVIRFSSLPAHHPTVVWLLPPRVLRRVHDIQHGAVLTHQLFPRRLQLVRMKVRSATERRPGVVRPPRNAFVAQVSAQAQQNVRRPGSGEDPWLVFSIAPHQELGKREDADACGLYNVPRSTSRTVRRTVRRILATSRPFSSSGSGSRPLISRP